MHGTTNIKKKPRTHFRILYQDSKFTYMLQIMLRRPVSFDCLILLRL